MVGDSPLYVRKVGERHKIVKQTDSGLGIDTRTGPGRPLSPEALLNISLPHNLVMGGISHAGSQQVWSKNAQFEDCYPGFVPGFSCDELCELDQVP